MSNYHYFTDAEIARWGLKPEVWAKLDMARGNSKTSIFPEGIPFIITSGLRTVGDNSILKGAVPDSSHLTGDGVDLWVEDAAHYFAMLKGLYVAGFRRIGHYYLADLKDANNFIPRHIHVDNDPTKPWDLAWCKREQN